MLNDDGDIVRAIGFLAIYSAYLEDEMVKIVQMVDKFSPFKNKIEQFRLADQARHLRKKLQKCFEEVSDYPAKDNDKQRVDILKDVERIAKERNEYLHSQYISESAGIIQENRHQNTSYVITSADIYGLAEDIFQLQGSVFGLIFVVERLKK